MTGFLLTGCWQEITYTGPDPGTTAAQSTPSLPASSTPASPDEASAVTSPSVDWTESVPAAEPPLLPPGADLALDEGFGESTAEAAEVDVETPLFPPEATEPEPAASEPVAETPLTEEATEPASSQPVAETPRSNFETLLPTNESTTPTEPAATPEPPTAPSAEVATTETPSASVPVAPTQPAADTRRSAFTLGSKFSLAALANDRGLAADKVAQFMAEAKQAADALGTHLSELPPPANPGAASASKPDVHDYLFQEGKRIWQNLVTRFGPDHAALFEVAMKSNALLALYGNDAKAPDAISEAVSQRAKSAGLPENLWRPLIDSIAKREKPADVRATVYRLHSDVDKYLAAGTQ